VVEKSRGGFEKALTTVPLVGTKTVTVKLTKGKWEFYCKPHEATMHGDFTVS
jgi:plastocyanin